jgi:tryptophan-rich sensory protein
MAVKTKNIFKLLLAGIFAFVWFILVQAEYEIITKPHLAKDFAIISGIWLVIFFAIVLIAIAAAIIALLYSIKKSKILNQNDLSKIG